MYVMPQCFSSHNVSLHLCLRVLCCVLLRGVMWCVCGVVWCCVVLCVVLCCVVLCCVCCGVCVCVLLLAMGLRQSSAREELPPYVQF